MSFKHFALATALFIAGVPLSGCMGTGEVAIERTSINGLPAVSARQTGKVEWKVDAVDYENRSVALTDAEGMTKIFRVRSDAPNFYRVKKGMKVQAEYSLTLNASVRKGAADPRTAVIETAARGNDLDQKPGILCERQAWVQASVKSIDPQTRQVQLQMVGGDVMSLQADKKLPGLDNVHVGDQVVFHYIEAIKFTLE
jgi:hypothetical protein